MVYNPLQERVRGQSTAPEPTGVSGDVTLDVRDVDVAAVDLHPLLHGSGHDLLRELVRVLQQHRVDLRTHVGRARL